MTCVRNGGIDHGNGYPENACSFDWHPMVGCLGNGKDVPMKILACPLGPLCTGDITGNGVVNVDDLLAVINSWGLCAPPCPPDIAPPGGGNGNRQRR